MSQKCLRKLSTAFRPTEVTKLQESVDALQRTGVDETTAYSRVIQDVLRGETKTQLEVDDLVRAATGQAQGVQPGIKRTPKGAPKKPEKPKEVQLGKPAKLTPELEAKTVKKTPGEMRQELAQYLGFDLVASLEETGVLILDESRRIKKSPKGGYRTIQGAYNLDDGTIRLYGGSQYVDRSTIGVLLHEGSHSGLDRLLGGRLPEFVNDVIKQAAAGSTLAQGALQKAGAAKLKPAKIFADDRAGFVAREEIVAYYIQDSVDQRQVSGVFRRLMNALKIAFDLSPFSKASRAVGIKVELTPEMAVEYAIEALRDTKETLEVLGQLQRAVELKSVAGGNVNSTKKPTKDHLESATAVLGEDAGPDMEALVLRDTGIHELNRRSAVSIGEGELLLKERIDKERVSTLEDILEDNLLFESYPELRKYKVNYARMDAGEATRLEDTIYIDSRAEDTGEIREAIVAQLDKILADQDGWLGLEGEKTPGAYPALGRLFAQNKNATVQREIKRLMTDPVAANINESVMESAAYLTAPVYDLEAQAEFLRVVPEEASFDEVQEAMDAREFKPLFTNLLEGLKRDDWLGFDYPAQAVNAVFSEDLSAYDLSQGTKAALGKVINAHELFKKHEPVFSELFSAAGDIVSPRFLEAAGVPEPQRLPKKTPTLSLNEGTLLTQTIADGSYVKEKINQAVGAELESAVDDYTVAAANFNSINASILAQASAQATHTINAFTEAEKYINPTRREEYLKAKQKVDKALNQFAVEEITIPAVEPQQPVEWAREQEARETYLKSSPLSGFADLQEVYDTLAQAGIPRDAYENDSHKVILVEGIPISLEVKADTDTNTLDIVFASLQDVLLGQDVGYTKQTYFRNSTAAFRKITQGLLSFAYERAAQNPEMKIMFVPSNDARASLYERGLKKLGVPFEVKRGEFTIGLPEQQLLDNLGGQVTELESAAELVEGVRKWLWTKPDESSQLGRAQRFLANYYDNIWTMEKKSEAVWDRYDLSKSRRSAMIDEVNRNFLDPMRGLIRETGLDLKEIDDWLAARHIILDNVNQNLAERSSLRYVNKLLKHLAAPIKAELKKKKTELLNQKLSPKQTREKMFELMDAYADQEQVSFDQRTGTQRQATKEQWEDFKRHGSGMYDARSGLNNRGGALNAADIFNQHKNDAKVAKVAKLYDTMTTEHLNMLREGGTITGDEHTNLLTENPHYVPLRRESFDYETQFSFLKGTGTGPSKGVTVRGGSADVNPPIHIMQNTFARLHGAAGHAQRNLANNFLYEQIIADRKNWTGWFTVGEDNTQERHTKLGFVVERGTANLEPTDLIVIRKGKRLIIKPIEQNERAMLFTAAANRLGAQEVSGVFKIFGWVNSIVRITSVSVSPAFILANMIRDPLTALYNMQATEAGEYTKQIKDQYKTSFKALIDVHVKGNRDPNSPAVQMVERFEKAGGKISFTQSLKEMDSSWKSFEREMWAEGTPGIKSIVHLFQQIENTNIAIENVMRLSTFEVLRDKIGADKAARIAKDLTTNFDRKGFKSSSMGLLYLFFNATIQGNAQVIRNISKSKKLASMVGGTLVMAALFDLIGRALADEDEFGNNEWDKITGKDRNIVLPIPINGVYIKIPAPWVYNVVWRLGGMLGETAAGARTAVDTASETAALVLSTFNPMGGGTVAQALTPTALDPLMQVIENKDFAGNQLRPINFPGAGSKPDSQLAWQSTPQEYKWLARKMNELSGGDVAHSGWIDVAPSTIQNTVNFLGGGLARFSMNVLSIPKDIATQELELKNVPILRQLTTQPGTSIDTQKYYDRVATVLAAEKAVKEYGRGATKDREKRAEARTKYKQELRLVSHVKDVERQLKSLRTRLRAAQGRGDTKRVEMLKERIQSVQRRFVATYEARLKR